MNWKKILRSAVCLLVVLAILLNCTPVKADASVAGAVVAGKIAIDALKVITAILIALGVSVGASRTDWEAVRLHIFSTLQNEGFVDQNGKIHVFTVEGTSYIYSATNELISRIRSLLYADGFLSSDVLSVTEGFYTETLTSRNLTQVFNYGSSTWPEEFVECLSSLGVNHKVMILGCTDSVLFGYHFNEAGQFVMSRFTNPLGVANATVIGVRLLSDLEYLSSSECIRTVVSGGITTNYYRDIYYSKYYAEKSSDYLTSNLAAFDFTGIPYYGRYDNIFACDSIFYRFFTKDSSNTVWYDSTYSYAISPDHGSYTVMAPSNDSFVWDSVSQTVVATPFDFTLQNVASEEKPLADAYPLWSAGVISVPGSDVGSEEEKVQLYPLGLGNTLDSTESLSQSDVWTGSNVSANTGTNTGSLAETITSAIARVFVPSSDYLTAKVDALAEKFPFVAPVVTLARTITLGFDDEEPEPPVIYLHLEDSRGSYDLGGTVAFIDMSWYAEYKPVGDALLSSLLWVVFVWRLFRQLPGLIAGMPGEFNARILDVLNVTPPSRSLTMEVQRQSNRETVRTALKDKGADK